MSQENVEVVRRAMDAYFQHGTEAMLAYMDPEFEWVEDPRVPGAITRRGHAEVKRYLESMPRYWRGCG